MGSSCGNWDRSVWKRGDAKDTLLLPTVGCSMVGSVSVPSNSDKMGGNGLQLHRGGFSWVLGAISSAESGQVLAWSAQGAGSPCPWRYSELRDVVMGTLGWGWTWGSQVVSEVFSNLCGSISWAKLRTSS